VLVAQDTERGGLQQIVASGLGRLAQPARGEHAQHVAVGEDQDVALRGADLGDHPVDSAADIRGLLTAGASVAPERPAGTDLRDLFGRHPFIAAVVPLHQLRSWLRVRAITGQPAGLGGSLEGAGQHQRELPALQLRAQGLRLPAPLLGEGNVGFAGVPTVKTPLCLTVPQEDRLGLCQAAASAGLEVEVRGAATDLDVVPVGRRGISRALPLEITAEGAAG